MKLYLLISWAALDEGKRAARMLEQAGHTVTNHFLRPDYTPPALPDSELPDDHVFRAAIECLGDLAQADVVVSMNISGASTAGGRHIEWGTALAMGKHLAIIGKPENIFQRMPGVKTYMNVGHLIDGLGDVRDWATASVADIAAKQGVELRTLVMIDPAKPEAPPPVPVRRFRVEMLPTSEEAPFMVELDATALEVDENGITMLRDKDGIVGVFYPGSAACVRRVDA